MKKLLASLLAFTILFSPVGNMIFNDEPVAEAKRYKSGKKSFNVDKQKTPTQSNIQKEKDKDKNSNTTATPNNKKSSGGEFMKGMIAGGLAGLLFGSLFANMGMLGSVLGFLINAAAIVFLIVIIKKVFTLFTEKKRREEEEKKWQH